MTRQLITLELNPSFNLALAQVLKGDVNKAKSTLDNVKDPAKTGKPAYLKAVVGARLDDKNYHD